jgi:hypothetical protein
MREFDVTVKNCTYLKLPQSSTSMLLRSNDDTGVTSPRVATSPQQQQQQRVKRLQRAPTNTLTVTMPTLHLDLDTEQVSNSLVQRIELEVQMLYLVLTMLLQKYDACQFARSA